MTRAVAAAHVLCIVQLKLEHEKIKQYYVKELTHKTPIEKTRENPTLFFNDMLSLQMTRWGMERMTRSSIRLMQAVEKSNHRRLKQYPGVQGIQNFLAGLQERLTTKMDAT